MSGVPHHITQRGNNDQDIFFVDDDRRVYLAVLKQQSYRYGPDVMACCLMSNHIHLVATPQTNEALAKAVVRTHLIYTQHISETQGRGGRFRQSRFHSSAKSVSHQEKPPRFLHHGNVANT